MKRKPPQGADLAAAQIIARAAYDLSQIAKSTTIPTLWRRWSARTLARPVRNKLALGNRDPLSHIFKRQLAAKEKRTAKPGRPATWTLRHHQHLVRRIEEIKAAGLVRNGKAPTDLSAIREFVSTYPKDWTSQERRREIEFLKRKLPTSRNVVTKSNENG